jgi:hypothetical protein
MIFFKLKYEHMKFCFIIIFNVFIFVKVSDENGAEDELKERMILYIIRIMEELKGRDYVILYACSGKFYLFLTIIMYTNITFFYYY